MKKVFHLVLATLLVLSSTAQAQRRSNTEIAADLERLAAELRLPEVISVPMGGDLAAALRTAPAGATVSLDGQSTYIGNYTLDKPVKLVSTGAQVLSPNGAPAFTITGCDVSITSVGIGSAATAQTNDLVVITGCNVALQWLTIQGNGATKRGVAANGSNMLLDNVKILGIGRVGTETQAVAIWDGTNLTIKKSTLEAGSTSFLAGGATPTVPNHVPADILIEDSLLTHDINLRGKGYANKTGFELKSGRRVVVRRSIIENIWVEGQTGFAITLTPSQYGNSPETVVEHVLFDNITVRNAGGGANIIGFTQHTDPTRSTLRLNDITFRDSTFTISRAVYGGQGALMQLGIEPADLVWERNTVITDGGAFIRTTDSKPITGFSFRFNSVDQVGTYGVFMPSANRGALWGQRFPGGLMEGNIFYAPHSIFKASFPLNEYR